MSKISYIQPNWYGTGLSKQIFFIIWGIINAIKNNQQILVIDKFRLEPLTHNMCNISDILNLSYLNCVLEKFNLKIFDINDFNFYITKVTYGTDKRYYEITNDITSTFYIDYKLEIPSHYCLNNIKGDPDKDFDKTLKIYYTINEVSYFEEYSGSLDEGVIINLKNPELVYSWNEIDNLIINERNLFNYLLQNIRFVEKYYNLSNNLVLLDKNNSSLHINHVNIMDKKINVIHLRLEKDITYNMSLHNNMDENEYINELEKKYIELINKYFNKNDIIYILSYDLNNNVIKYLMDNNYEFYSTKKNIFQDRVPHAIMDLLLSTKCDGTFIGNWQHHKNYNMGSTFSYVIDILMKNHVNKIFIDLYDIKKSEILL
jgi:hypothetical protein